jgi:hypothetical protein
MALSRGQLREVIPVAASATIGIVTVASSKKVYVKNITLHNTGAATTANAVVYFIPNGGSAGSATEMYDIDLSKKETVSLDLSYPFVMDTTGDVLTVKALVTQVNVMVTGDVES